MKKEIYNQYKIEIVRMFRLKDGEILSKTKRRDIVDARNMLYYLCATRPMRVRDIQEYIKEDGYSIGHSSIVQGIKNMSDRIESDKDYVAIVKKIEGCVI
jgi:chromosomal replication initiation ATPase DnaA|tara:strand:- start:1019 stop:1318 length:300 start_codon:yes stop_codon:yes gene_type:complete